MEPIAAFNHLLNFFAPALALAVAMPLLALAGHRVWPGWRPLLARMATTGLVGAVVLLAGLVVFERDGKMVTYLALVAAAAAVTAGMPLKPRARKGPRGR